MIRQDNMLITKCLIIFLLMVVGSSCNSQRLSQESAKGFTTKVEGPYDYITQKDLSDLGLWNHDAPMPFVRLGENDYWIYLSEGGAKDGKHSHIIRVRTDLNKVDKSSVENIQFSGIPDANVNQYNGWKAWLFNLYEINSKEWLAITHIEDQDDKSKEEFRMSVEYSNDGAKSFNHIGFILKPEIDSSIIKKTNYVHKYNIAGGGFRWDDTYFYVYFSDMNEPDRSDRHIAVARANKNEVIENARKGKNTVWHKYYNGKWNEPGMGGRSASLGKLHEYDTYIMYNSFIEKWIAFDVQGNLIKMLKSSDPLDFNMSGEVICKLPEGFTAAYCTIVPLDQVDMNTCGKEFYVYYRYWTNSNRRIFDTDRLKVSFEKKQVKE